MNHPYPPPYRLIVQTRAEEVKGIVYGSIASKASTLFPLPIISIPIASKSPNKEEKNAVEKEKNNVLYIIWPNGIIEIPLIAELRSAPKRTKVATKGIIPKPRI